MRSKILLAAFIISIGFLMGGCQSDTSVRDGMDQGTATIRKERQQWSRILAGDNNNDGHVTVEDGVIDLSKLPDLSQKDVVSRDAWLQARETAESQYDALVKGSRANDTSVFSKFFPAK